MLVEQPMVTRSPVRTARKLAIKARQPHPLLMRSANTSV